MKKSALIITSLALLAVAIFAPRAKAQTFDFNKAYQDYLFALNVYQGAYSDYQDSRDFYLKNPTLTLKEDARQKTLAMLKDRDKLLSVYLTMLRMKIVETKGLSTDDKNAIFGKIDPEVKWYQDHLNAYQDGDQLDALFTKSNEAQNEYKNTTLPVIYESLFDISLGAEMGIRQDQEAIYSSLKNIINAGVAAGTLDINPFNRWFSDIDAVINILKDNDTKAKNKIQTIDSGQSFSLSSTYSDSVSILSSSVTSLSELNNFLTEVLNSIKNQQK